MPVSIILPMLHTLLHLTSIRTKGWNMGALQQRNSFVDNEKCWKDRWYHTESVQVRRKEPQDFLRNWTGWPKNSQPFWKPDVHYHVHHSLLWNPVISHMKAHHGLLLNPVISHMKAHNSLLMNPVISHMKAHHSLLLNPDISHMKAHHSLLLNPVISHVKAYHSLTPSDWCS